MPEEIIPPSAGVNANDASQANQSTDPTIVVPETLGALAAKTTGKDDSNANNDENSTKNDVTSKKPELIDGRFKTQEDLLKSYKELEKHKNEGLELKKNFGAPENGEYVIPIEDAEVAEKFMQRAGKSVELLNSFAKENNFSQDMYNNMFNKLTEHVQNKLETTRTELLSVENAAQRLQTLNNWFGQNFDFNQFPGVQNVPMTKDMLLFFETVKSKMTGASNMPFANESTAIKAGTLEEAHKEMVTNMDKYKKDEGYRKEMQDRIRNLEKTQGRQSYGQPKFGK